MTNSRSKYDIRRAINYVSNHIDMDAVGYARLCIAKHHSSVREENPYLLDQIYDLMEEYSEIHDLPENWWLNEMDEEEIFDELK